MYAFGHLREGAETRKNPRISAPKKPHRCALSVPGHPENTPDAPCRKVALGWKDDGLGESREILKLAIVASVAAFVEGRLQTRTDEAGQRTKVVADQLIILGKAMGKDGNGY
jgi:hypothetical protein